MYWSVNIVPNHDTLCLWDKTLINIIGSYLDKGEDGLLNLLSSKYNNPKLTPTPIPPTIKYLIVCATNNENLLFFFSSSIVMTLLNASTIIKKLIKSIIISKKHYFFFVIICKII